METGTEQAIRNLKEQVDMAFEHIDSLSQDAEYFQNKLKALSGAIYNHIQETKND